MPTTLPTMPRRSKILYSWRTLTFMPTFAFFALMRLGAKQFAATYRQAFPDLEHTIEDMVAEGDKVVVRFRGRGTHQGDTEAFGPPTGKRMEITGITIKRLSEGKIVEAWTNFDALGMMQQLGMIPEPGQAAS